MPVTPATQDLVSNAMTSHKTLADAVDQQKKALVIGQQHLRQLQTQALDDSHAALVAAAKELGIQLP